MLSKKGQHVVSVATDQTVSDGLTEDVLMGGGATIVLMHVESLGMQPRV